MRPFILKTFWFVFPLVVLALAIELLTRNIPNDYSFKKKYLDTNSLKIENLILGNSHAYYGLNPGYFRSLTYNASYISQSLDIDTRILSLYENRLSNLQTVIIPISYFSMFGSLKTGPEYWRVKNYVIYYGLEGDLPDHSEVFSTQLFLNLKRICAYYFTGISGITCTDLGWGTGFNSSRGQDLSYTGKSAALRHAKRNLARSREGYDSTEIKKAIDTMIVTCKRKNVKVLFFTPPAYETYRQHLDTAQLNATARYMHAIVQENNNCKYLSLLNDTTFAAGDFYDADHLNEIGAKKLSTLIDDTITHWNAGANLRVENH